MARAGERSIDIMKESGLPGLASITQTCTPRPDVVGGGLADNHFAAQLDQVVRNPSGYPIYGDPNEFFAITYPTNPQASVRRNRWRRRLRAAGAYKAYYEDLAGRGEVFSGGAEQPATYGDLVARSYPFHPELVRVLDKRIGSISNFNRARGALKLLAEVVVGVWQDKRDVEILNVADVDFRRSAVLSHLTVGIESALVGGPKPCNGHLTPLTHGHLILAPATNGRLTLRRVR